MKLSLISASLLALGAFADAKNNISPSAEGKPLARLLAKQDKMSCNDGEEPCPDNSVCMDGRGGGKFCRILCTEKDDCADGMECKGSPDGQMTCKKAKKAKPDRISCTKENDCGDGMKCKGRRDKKFCKKARMKKAKLLAKQECTDDTNCLNGTVCENGRGDKKICKMPKISCVGGSDDACPNGMKCKGPEGKMTCKKAKAKKGKRR